MISTSKFVDWVSGVMLAAVAAACVSTAAPAANNDPASVEAPTAAAPEGASVLASVQEPAAPTQASSTPVPEVHDHAAHANEEQATIYTCPMHPEIRENKPGRCPKCGMNLEPAKPDSQ